MRCSSNCIAAMARTTALRRSKDDLAAANPATPLLTFALDFHRKESVCGGHGPSLTGSLLSPASAAWPPRGLGGGGAMLRRHVLKPARGLMAAHVCSLTCTLPQSAKPPATNFLNRSPRTIMLAEAFRAELDRGMALADYEVVNALLYQRRCSQQSVVANLADKSPHALERNHRPKGLP